jgi:hypothetical protein
MKMTRRDFIGTASALGGGLLVSSRAADEALEAAMTAGQSSRLASLAGTWSCRLDPAHRGMVEGWQNGTVEEHRVSLPGTTHTNGIGPRYEKKLISSLTPVTNHVGPAWYWRDIELSGSDCNRHVELSLERCCWESFVWLNGKALGTRDSLVAPHEYDLSAAVRPGTNRLTVMIDNSNLKNKAANAGTKLAEAEELLMVENAEKRLKCGGHHTLFLGYVWNGITGWMNLRVRPRVRIAIPRVYPDVRQRKISVRCTIINDLDQPVAARLNVSAGGLQARGLDLHTTTEMAAIEPGRQTVTVEMDMGDDVRLWSEHTPELYRLVASLVSTHGTDRHETEFGMRELSQAGTRLAINGRPVFLRGALENFVHPLTGYPPADMASWMEILGVNKAHGLNHVRFHTCCPPEAAFAAADRLGIMLNVELPGCSGGEPDEAVTTDYLQAEALRILDTFGNHPSFCMLTMGNEVLTDERDQREQTLLMARVARCKEHDPRHLYCCTAQAYTKGRDDDFYQTAWPNGATAKERHQGEPLRGFRWNGGDVVNDSRFNTRAPETTMDYRDGIAGIDRPVITHEVGMWAVYPDISEIPMFNGVLKPFNLEIIRDYMEAMGTIHLADSFVQASGQLGLLLYKEEIESALRTPGLAGFQLLGLHDHPPQGTSTVGMITALRKSKGIVTPARFSQFCGETVPLVRLRKRTFTTDETFEADVDLAHYGPADLLDKRFAWRLLSAGGDVRAKGEFAAKPLPTGELTRLGSISVALSQFHAPEKFRIEVYQHDGPAMNSWDCWVYHPPVICQPKNILWANSWSAELATRVAAGQTTILELGREQIPHARRGCFTSLLWNPIMKRHHRSQTMGILCDPAHPALSGFPTEAHTNWQWWDVIHPSLVMDLDGMSPRPEPVVRMIDSFIGNHCLGLMFEVKLGEGRLFVTSLDLSNDLATRHAARQLRQCLLDYVASDAFRPQVAILPGEIDRLIEAHRRKPVVPTRTEVVARFDQPVVRESPARQPEKKTE